MIFKNGVRSNELGLTRKSTAVLVISIMAPAVILQLLVLLFSKHTSGRFNNTISGNTINYLSLFFVTLFFISFQKKLSHELILVLSASIPVAITYLYFQLFEEIQFAILFSILLGNFLLLFGVNQCLLRVKSAILAIMLGFTIATLINRSIVIIYRYNLFHTEITTKRIIFEITYILFVNIFILIFSKLFRIRNSPDQVYYEDILDQDAE